MTAAIMDPHAPNRRASYPHHLSSQHPPPPAGHYPPPPTASPSTYDSRHPPPHHQAYSQGHPPPGPSPAHHSSYPPPPATQPPPQQQPPPHHHYPHQPAPPAQQSHPPPPQQQHHPHHQQYHPPAAHPPPPPTANSGPLPPIQTPQEQNSLPPIRDSAQPHDPRAGSQEYMQQYNTHNRAGHATPGAIARSYSQHERTPTTPSVPQPFSTPAHPPSTGSEAPHIAPPPPPPQQHPPHPPHSAPPAAGPPPPHMMEHGGHANGYPQPNGYGMPAPPPHHDPHGQPYMGAMVEHHAGYPPAPMYGSTAYGPGPAQATALGKRKALRATQACEQCRQRKQKCDEGNPCSFCKEQGLSCSYRDTVAPKADKNMEQLLAYMKEHGEKLGDLASKITGFDDRIRKLENGQGGNARANSSASNDEPVENREKLLADEEEDDMRRKRKSDRLSDHRTAPHKLLLLWPSVRPLLTKAGIKLSDGYVMEAEDRGMLRLWTAGEAYEELDGTQPGGPASPAKSEDSNDGPTPNQDGRWGGGFTSMPPPNEMPPPDRSPGLGGRKPNGELDLDVVGLMAAFESYMRHMHVMHPFLDRRRVRRMFDKFCIRYGTGRSRATFAVGNNNLDADARPMKRQRSNGSTAIPISSQYDHGGIRSTDAIERSPGNAIILLVIALGKICMHREPLQGPIATSRAQQNALVAHSLARGPSTINNSFNSSFTSSSPGADVKMSMSPNATPTTQPTPPAENGGYRYDSARSRRPSTDSPGVLDPRRNIDVMPGLAYYAKAAEILGEQADGNDLVHAQMFLLAGLYKGQLARVKESLSWITMAGRAVLTLLDRYKLYNENYWTAYGDVKKSHKEGQARIKDTRQALIVIASWTCLQLETDILAEMKLPPSGIQQMENLLLMPYKSPDEGEAYILEPDVQPQDYDNILMYYCAQLFLRRRLNKVHTEIYGPDCFDQSLPAVQAMLSGHEDVLERWRESLPPDLKWHDDDPPPGEILAARLRAKYWGARYVINRPFLDYALHIWPHVKEGRYTVEEVAKDAYGNPRDKADIHLFRAIQGMGDKEVLRACQRCIDAAVKSTLAFDGIKDRLTVTNIHGTAHAQFGNMLVLSASFHSAPWLKTIVQEERLKPLLTRTIKFLRNLSKISPTCSADCYILERFQQTLFPSEADDVATYRDQGLEPQASSTMTPTPIKVGGLGRGGSETPGSDTHGGGGGGYQRDQYHMHGQGQAQGQVQYSPA